MWPFIFNRVMVCMAIFPLFTACVFVTNHAYAQAIILFVTVPIMLVRFNSFCFFRSVSGGRDRRGAALGCAWAKPGTSEQASAASPPHVVVEDVRGATGLELKSDPGVPAVYAGFGGLMVTTLISYLSHSQVWALQQGSSLFVTGRTNRAKLAFEKEYDELLNAVPELQRAVPES
ncbi:Cytochrome c biogenesis protein CCS1, chloroplastic, partial [Tetrabaena socialis]